MEVSTFKALVSATIFIAVIADLALAQAASRGAVAASVPHEQSIGMGGLGGDRVSITKRLLKRLAQTRSFGSAMQPEVIPPIAHYRKIHRVDFLPPGQQPPYSTTSLGLVTDLNNLGQITFIPDDTTKPDTPTLSYVIDDDGTHHLLSGAFLPPLIGPNAGAVAFAYGLNNVGGVAGSYFVTGFTNGIGGARVAWHRAGTVYDVSYFDSSALYSQLLAINDLNVAAGTSAIASDPSDLQGTIFSAAGVPQSLLPLEFCSPGVRASAYQAEATGINDLGVIIGYEVTDTAGCEIQQAVQFSVNGYAKAIFPSRMGYESGAEAINQRGDIVGWVGAGQSKAFLLSKDRSSVTYIPRPIGEHEGSSFALGINDRGDVVGAVEQYPNGNGNSSYLSAFLFTHGRSYDLNALLPPNSGWTILSAIAINNSGEIVGEGNYFDPHTKRVIQASYAMKP